MKISLIPLLFVVAASVPTAASAHSLDSKRLRDAATGQTIAVGRTSFRLIPGAVLRPVEAGTCKDQLAIAVNRTDDCGRTAGTLRSLCHLS